MLQIVQRKAHTYMSLFTMSLVIQNIVNIMVFSEIMIQFSVFLNRFRENLIKSVRSDTDVVVASYDRAQLDQTGSGHFSPLAAYHSATDSVLIMDVARFK